LGYLYQRIRVDKIDVHSWGYNTCASPLIIGWIFRSSHGSAVTSGVQAQQIMMEMPDLSSGVSTLVPYVAGNTVTEFNSRGSRSISAIEGLPSLSDNDYSSSFGSEPTTQCYADLVLCSADGAAVSSTANAHVRIVYHVTVSEPNQTYTD